MLLPLPKITRMLTGSVDVECQRPRRVRIALQGAPSIAPGPGLRRDSSGEIHHETNSIRSIRSSCSSRPNTSAFSGSLPGLSPKIGRVSGAFSSTVLPRGRS